MKAHWSERDLSAMPRRELRFAPDDTRMILTALTRPSVATAQADPATLSPSPDRERFPSPSSPLQGPDF